jgi:hypothetical protein
MVDIKVFVWARRMRNCGQGAAAFFHFLTPFRFLETKDGGQNFYFLFSYPTNKQQEKTGDVTREQEKTVPLR